MSDVGKELEQLVRERFSQRPGAEHLLDDLVEIIRISVDAGRSEAADEIASLRAQLAQSRTSKSYQKDRAVKARRAQQNLAQGIDYWKDRADKAETQLASARKALEWRTDFENAPSPCIGWCVFPAGQEVRQIWRHPHLKDQWSAYGVTQEVKAWQPLPALTDENKKV